MSVLSIPRIQLGIIRIQCMKTAAQNQSAFTLRIAGTSRRTSRFTPLLGTGLFTGLRYSDEPVACVLR
ncbi:hypothetical protein BMONG18_0097 [Bifidobacterium mongoliense]|uniref:Uncharacterized protein n=1 Tax=Bifidobacterium mongoliense TaxID=518643 RepID=A0A423UFU7_9BIFI|nr:hypothetical protein BMONG18_0097 [Bifidobacterium mongoliense]